ncbi:MAG TPA: Holliday junction resolvase RuvX [Candidatus Babeliaceae bacterium]|nr:Holliday junction resolvase RuvX [Candidatus Babeliaceae bacterium]
MAKIAALDLGDQWTGIALSDSSKLLAKPYTTTSTDQLYQTLDTLFAQEDIDTVILGYPKTMRGTISDQTRKIIAMKEDLEKHYTTKSWILWDERLSSKRAESMSKLKTKEDKIKLHARAAAFILDSYLTFLIYHKEQ